MRFEFSVFGIPVRVQPLFWLIALVIAPPEASIFGGRFDLIVSWVILVFVSVLGHELGHALVARSFGAHVDMTLHGLGGYTRWYTDDDIGPWRRVIVAGAGSLTGFALAGLVWLILRMEIIPSEWQVLTGMLGWFVFVNIFWGVLNWLPIRPLDGGHMLLGTLQAAFGERGVKIANVIFPVATLIGGLIAFANGYLIAAIFAAFLMMEEVREWNRRSLAGRPPTPADHRPFSLFDQDERPGRPEEPTQPIEVDAAEPDGEKPPEVG